MEAENKEKKFQELLGLIEEIGLDFFEDKFYNENDPLIRKLCDNLYIYDLDRRQRIEIERKEFIR